MARPVIVDLRNIYRADEMARRGFVYESVGRPKGAHGIEVCTARRSNAAREKER